MSMSKKTIFIIFVVAVISLAILIFCLNCKTAVSTKPISLTLDKVAETDHYLGNKEAKLVIVEYSDFQCPACAYYEPIARQAVEAYKDKAVLIYRDFPLRQIHKNSDVAAQAVEAAGKQGKFFEMSEKMFINQQNWSNSDNPNDIFLTYAEELGLDKDLFVADSISKIIKDKIENDLASGEEFDLTYTPTFYFNGDKVENPQDLESFKVLIEEYLNK